MPPHLVIHTIGHSNHALEAFLDLLQRYGITHVPDDPALYDPGDERPNYDRMERTTAYQAGIERLAELAARDRVVVMCSESDYHQCHRHLLITQTLLSRGVQVVHIQSDGTSAAGEAIAQQLSLF